MRIELTEYIVDNKIFVSERKIYLFGIKIYSFYFTSTNKNVIQGYNLVKEKVKIGFKTKKHESKSKII